MRDSFLDVGIRIEKICRSQWGYITAFFTYILSFYINIFNKNHEQVFVIVSVFLLDLFFGTLAGIKNEGFSSSSFKKGVGSIIVWLILYFILVSIENNFDTPNLAKTLMGVVLLTTIVSTLKNIVRLGWIKNKQIVSLFDFIDAHKTNSIVEKLKEEFKNKDVQKKEKTIKRKKSNINNDEN